MKVPKFYKRNGFYYIFAPAGGVAGGWQMAFRSKDPFGPYEAKIVLAQGKTSINGPHQGGYVELNNGEGWFIHFQEKQPYGRIIHLEPVKWIDDWPVMGEDADGDGTGQPVITHAKPDLGSTYPIMTPQESDEFDSKQLGLQWQWQANFSDQWYSLSENPGQLRLYAQFTPGTNNSVWMVPNQLLQKLPAPTFTATALVVASHLMQGENAGLVMMGMDYAALTVTPANENFKLNFSVCNDAFGGRSEHPEASVELQNAKVWLRIAVENRGKCRFSYSNNGTDFTVIGTPFQAVKGRWIGAKVGIFAHKNSETGLNGYADFDWFRIEKN